MPDSCRFCPPNLTAPTLWENAAYRIIADQFPICVGHILVISKNHYPCHMHAPIAQMAEFETAQHQARRFLYDIFGRASFMENGSINQEVPHAHLHSLPFTLLLPDSWLEEGILQSVAGWQAVRQKYEQVGHYSYAESGAGRCVLQDDENYPLVLNLVRSQLVTQTEAQMSQGKTALKRSGADMTADTIRLWQAWAQNR